MDIERDRRTVHAVLCEIGWADPNAEPAQLHLVELEPAAPPVRDVIVALDDVTQALIVRVRFLPPQTRLGSEPVLAALQRANDAVSAGVFGIDDEDGSVFLRHTLDLGECPLAADDVRRTVLTALETISDHAFEIARAAAGRSPARAD